MLTQPLLDSGKLPLLLEPESGNEFSCDFLNQFLQTQPELIDEWLLRHGALLLRGFEVNSPGKFSAIASTLTGELKPYCGGDSPRHAVLENVYTSTEFPSHMEISLHNELTYSGWWPNRVVFWCKRPSATGGQTQIADARAVFREVDPAIRNQFVEKGVLYLRSYHNQGGAGKSWQHTFETDQRDVVEQFCLKSGMQIEWFEWGLRTRTYGPGVYRHPVTGEMAWINQADQYHAAFNTPWADQFDPGDFDEDQYPFHACYGDGSPIDPDDLGEVRRAGSCHEVLFDWEAGDVLVLDNILTMHGRKPYSGEREILVAMG
jgi:alpha-ketoglutarate-dependent taurine dioxygenase